MINRFVPLGSLAPIAVGGIMRFAIKNPMVQTVADGMIVAGISAFIAQALAGRLGFSEGRDNDEFSENRIGGVNFG